MAQPLPPAKRARIEGHIVSEELAGALPVVTEWMSRYGADTSIEIESRLRNVSRDEFDAILRQLKSFSGWSYVSEQVTTDVKYESGIRQTTAPGMRVVVQEAKFIAKNTVHKHDLSFRDGSAVRISVCSEDRCGPPASSDMVVNCRQKTRRTFCHKQEILYELTIVRSGRSQEEAMSPAARIEWEVELEWCGQARSSLYPSPVVLAQKLLMKVDDLLRMRRAAAVAALAAAAVGPAV